MRLSRPSIQFKPAPAHRDLPRAVFVSHALPFLPPHVCSVYVCASPPSSPVNQNTKSFKAAKRKKAEQKKHPQSKPEPKIPPPNHPLRGAGGALKAGGAFKPPNKGDVVRAAMRDGKKPGSEPVQDNRPLAGFSGSGGRGGGGSGGISDASAKMAAARAAARKEGSAKAQAARAAFIKEATAVNHVAAAKAESAAEFGGGAEGATATSAYTGGRGAGGGGAGAGAGSTDRSGRKQVISSLFGQHKDRSKLPSAADLGVSTNKSSTRSATETVFAVDSMKDLQIEDRLARHMTEQMGIQSLTTVQKMALPSLLKRRDCLIKSATGQVLA